MTGVFLVKYGMDIEFLFGIKEKKFIVELKHQLEMAGIKILTLLIHGFLQAFGHFQHSDGQI